MALEREIETYRRKLPELLVHKGKFALIYGDQVEGIFNSRDDALTEGYEQHLHESFLVRRITDKENVFSSSRSIRPCPTLPSPSIPTAQ